MSEKSEQHSACPFSEPLAHASGPIDYGFTNDHMFRSVLQQNNRVLKSLICSLLHLNPDEVVSVEITNPIHHGHAADDKEFLLDIDVILNGNTLINLEMQLLNKGNWPERSLSYLCRRFDQLSSGEDYISCKPAHHIGFLDFQLFPEYAEFYATYKLLNIKNHHLYSDKFTLRVVDLSHIELATEEDRAYGIDLWARLFKSKTWEELKMIANDNPALTEVSESLYVLNADEMEREFARARAEREAFDNYYTKKTAEQAAQIEKLVAQIGKQASQLGKQASQIEEQAAVITALQAELEKYRQAENAE